MNTISWFVVVVIVAALLVLGTWDEELQTEVREWLEPTTPAVNAQENGFFALMGLFAAHAEQPHDVGRARVRAYEVALAASAPGEEPGFSDYPLSERLSLGTDLDTLCQVEKRRCLDAFAEQVDTVRALSLKHQTLLERYSGLSQFERFVTTTSPSLYEPLIAAELLSGAQRLYLARIAIEFATQSRLRAVESLARDIRFLRYLLSQADQVVLKILTAEMLARDVHLYSEFLDSPGFVHRHLPNLAPVLGDLSEKERSMSTAIRREFMAMASVLLVMPGSREMGLDVDLPRWMSSIFYKPGATLNRSHRGYARLETLSGLPPAEMRGYLPTMEPEPVPRLDYVLNPIGTVLTEVSAPNLVPYIERVNDLTGLSRLVRLKRALRESETPASEIESSLAGYADVLGAPYEGGPMRWDPRRQLLYFDGLSDRAYLTELALDLKVGISL